MGVEGACGLCPRGCKARGKEGMGFCGASDDRMEVAAVCLHRGEEPPISGTRGIVNVFFAHCNLQCIYCQNGDISGHHVAEADIHFRTVGEVVDRICELLPQSSGMLGMVTAAHYADRVPAIVEEVHKRGFEPTVVYNSSGYERVETLRQLEGWVDVYLPDLKYADAELAGRYSNATDYPEVAKAAIAEMRRQVGGGLKVADGVAYRGMVVRHLVLPAAVDNSIHCLEWLSEEFPLGLHLSLMAQYYPPKPNLPDALGRTITREEYEQVVAKAVELGLTDGWIQELESQSHYRPDFSKDNPFES